MAKKKKTAKAKPVVAVANDGENMDGLTANQLKLISSIEASDYPSEVKKSLITQLKNPQVADMARRKVKSALPPSTKCLLVNLGGEVEVNTLDLDKVKDDIAGIASLSDIDVVSVEAKRVSSGRGGPHAPKRVADMATEMVSVYDANGKKVFDGTLLDFAVENSEVRPCKNGENLPNLVYASSGKKQGLNPLERFLRVKNLTVCKQGTKEPLPIGLHSTLGKV